MTDSFASDMFFDHEDVFNFDDPCFPNSLFSDDWEVPNPYPDYIASNDASALEEPQQQTHPLLTQPCTNSGPSTSTAHAQQLQHYDHQDPQQPTCSQQQSVDQCPPPPIQPTACGDQPHYYHQHSTNDYYCVPQQQGQGYPPMPYEAPLQPNNYLTQSSQPQPIPAQTQQPSYVPQLPVQSCNNQPQQLPALHPPSGQQQLETPLPGVKPTKSRPGWFVAEHNKFNILFLQPQSDLQFDGPSKPRKGAS